MGSKFYYHSEEDQAVACVDVLTEKKTYRKAFAGYGVTGFVAKFSVASGDASTSSHRNFDERDGEQDAIHHYLMRAPFIEGMIETKKDVYEAKLAEYKQAHATSSKKK